VPLFHPVHVAYVYNSQNTFMLPNYIIIIYIMCSIGFDLKSWGEGL